MRRRMLRISVYPILFSLSVMLLLLNTTLARGEGLWNTTALPGYVFVTVFDTRHGHHDGGGWDEAMIMTVLHPNKTFNVYQGPDDAIASTFYLHPVHADSDMHFIWVFFDSDHAELHVNTDFTCTTNCLLEPGQVVSLTRFIGDENPKGTPSRVPKTGQTRCTDHLGDAMPCEGTGQDGEYQYGVLPAVMPTCTSDTCPGAYTVHG